MRDYGTAAWIGGDAECDHAVGRFTTPVSDKQRSNNGSGTIQARETCPKCGATRVDRQLGLERTPEEYVCHLVELFRELRRALKDDGTLWLNLGDSFAGGKGQSGSRGAEFQEGRNGRGESMNRGYQTLGGAKLTKPTDDRAALRAMGLKPKDLVGIPWRVAFALQADGWYLRQDIIWAKAVSGNIRKGSAMPESVRDRFCKSHEYIFLLSKSPRYYFDADAVADMFDDTKSHEYNMEHGNENMLQVWDSEAVGDVQQEQSTGRWFDGDVQGMSRAGAQGVGQQIQSLRESADSSESLLLFREGTGDQKSISQVLRADRGTAGEIPTRPKGTRKRGKIQSTSKTLRPESEGQKDEGAERQEICQDTQRTLFKAQDGNQAQVSGQGIGLSLDQSTVGTNQSEIREPLCVLQPDDDSLRDGSCDSIVKRGNSHSGKHRSGVPNMQRKEGQPRTATRRDVWLITPKPYKGAHFATYPEQLIEPCILAGSRVGDIVLDPFSGAGTTMKVAARHNRNGIGFELNQDYMELSRKRLLDDGGMFIDVRVSYGTTGKDQLNSQSDSLHAENQTLETV